MTADYKDWLAKETAWIIDNDRAEDGDREDELPEDEHQEDELDPRLDQTGPSPHHDATALQDAHLAETVANRALRGRYCWAAGLGWMRYADGRWRETPEPAVGEQVRRDLIRQYAQEAEAGATTDRLTRLTATLAVHRIRALVTLARGILEVDAADFDQHPDLLNVGNGVVDLATGELGPHSPWLYLTKQTKVAYRPDATHPDWTTALGALPVDIVDWFQVRIGQSATGHMTPDDLLLLLQGGGANGKTTLMGAIATALGDHAVSVPERALMANPSDHPTEMMAFRGARFAMIEETPEARHLNVQRLKVTIGTPTMQARLIARDNVTWDCTHSLFITSNYLPRVDETDHGTWRRLALVRFLYTYSTENVSVGDGQRLAVPGLRERLREGRQGQHEAVLAWIVAGARRWYDADRLMPPLPQRVVADTAAWRGEADLVCGYITDRLTFEPDFHVIATELYEDFTEWIEQRGHKKWADQTLTQRFAGHNLVTDANVEKRRITGGPWLSRRHPGSTPPSSRQYVAWLGARFRESGDDQ